MSFFLAIFAALAPPFLLIVLGHALKRARVLHPAHVPILNGIVLQVLLPALVLRGLLRAPSLPPERAILPLALLGAEAGAMALAYGLGRAMVLSGPMRGALLIVGVFGNVGFIGYPLTLALLPALFPVTILLDQFGMTIPLYLCAAVAGAHLGGQDRAGGGGPREAILRFGRSPVFLAAVAGLGLRLVPVPAAWAGLPALRLTGQVGMECLGYLGQGTIPLILLALGVALRPGAARARPGPLLAACALKLLVCPLLMWGLCVGLGIKGDLREVSILAASMPPAVVGSLLCARNDLEGDFAVGVVFVATVLSAVTVPLLLTWLR